MGSLLFFFLYALSLVLISPIIARVLPFFLELYASICDALALPKPAAYYSTLAKGIEKAREEAKGV